MDVKELMSKNPRTIGPDASLQEAAQAMREADIGAMPVCEKGELVGMLTDRDIVIRSTSGGYDPCEQRVGDIMTKGVFHIFEDQEVQEAAWLMEIKQVRRLPVVDAAKHLIGIISLCDLSTISGDRQLSSEVLARLAETTANFKSHSGDPSVGWTFSRL